MSQLERIYYFHRQVAARRYPNATAICERFEVSASTAHRDIAYLRDRLLAPLEYHHGRKGYFYRDRNFTLPFEKVDGVLSIFAVLNTLAEDTGLNRLPEMKSLKNLLANFLSADHHKLARKVRCQRIEVHPPDPELLQKLLSALQDERQITMKYVPLSGNGAGERTVDPLRLISYQGQWYLVGYCHLRKELRTFHLARIQTLEVTRRPCRPPSSDLPDPDTHIARAFGIFKGEPTHRVKILFTGTAADIVRGQIWHHDQNTEETPDGLVLTLPVADLTEIKMKILQFGRRARALDPPELVRDIAEEIDAMYTQTHEERRKTPISGRKTA